MCRVIRDMFAEPEPQQLPIQDGELRLWQKVDLGQDYNQLLAGLVVDSAWRQEQITVYGKAYRQPRLSAWYGDLGYSYSGIRLEPEPWTPTLQAIRERVETLVGHDFNSVLLNYYRDHNDRMGMHSDDEKELGPRPVIASLSLGAVRNFLLRHKTRRDLPGVKLPLRCGSMLLMSGDLQRHWRHGINAQRQACGARINLTFRRIIPRPGPGPAR
jgi:alkylated DNA repair dioxygenase AlkB